MSQKKKKTHMTISDQEVCKRRYTVVDLLRGKRFDKCFSLDMGHTMSKQVAD